MTNIFYDIESFPQTYLAVFVEEDGTAHRFVHQQSDKGNPFAPAQELIKGKTLVGYNNRYYDDNLLPLMLNGIAPSVVKEHSEELVHGVDFKPQTPLFNQTLDCFQQIDVSQPGLKKIEANMGLRILETTIPFDYPNELSDEQLAIELEYCEYDVRSTIKVYQLRKDNYFEAKESLVKMLPTEKQGFANKLNTTTLANMVLLGDSQLERWADVRVTPQAHELAKQGDAKRAFEADFFQHVPQQVIDLWRDQEKGSVTIHNWDCDFVFGFGGLHGSSTLSSHFENVHLMDVQSMYPHIILNLKILGDDAVDGTPAALYKRIMTDRIGLKKTDPPLAAAYKIVLNSVYGNLRNKYYENLYNPQAAKAVCFYGQIALYELCGRISPYVNLVNINTDGVGFTLKDEADDDKVMTICHDWEQEFKFNLEKTIFEKWIQKDVNNYIAISGDHIKAKGGMVARFQNPKLFNNNSTRIIDVALAEFLLNGTPIEDTIQANLSKPDLFQFVLQAGRTYEGTFDENGKKYNHVNRVFAGVGDGTLTLMKRYPAEKKKNPVKFANAPEHMLIWNDELPDGPIPNLDTNFYADLINSNLKTWQREPHRLKSAQDPIPAGTKPAEQSAETSADTGDIDLLTMNDPVPKSPSQPPANPITESDANQINFAREVIDTWGGLYVSPLRPRMKAPPDKEHTYKHATQDNTYWVEHPDANIGLALMANRIIMLDVDINHNSGYDGERFLADWLKQNGETMPETYTEMTPNGGKHYFFTLLGQDLTDHDSRRFRKNKIGLWREDSGIDVQVYIAPVAPSVVAIGDYLGQYTALNDLPINPRPTWLITALRSSAEERNQDQPKTKAERVETLKSMEALVVDEGGRDDALFQYGALYKRTYNPDYEELALKMFDFNKSTLDPPLPDKVVGEKINYLMRD